MAIPLERQLLDKMLTDGALDAVDVERLIQLPEETDYLEFKDGAELDDQKKAAATVRHYTTGFANAAGGLLVFGDSDGKPPARRLTTTKAPGKQGLAAWASSALAPVAEGFMPFPRIQALSANGCDLLIVATRRAPDLIACNGEYWMRFGDSTRPLPPHLATDLLLGRRAHPLLEPRPYLDSQTNTYRAVANGPHVRFIIDVENVGMLHADRVLVGIISWALLPRDPKEG